MEMLIIAVSPAVVLGAISFIFRTPRQMLIPLALFVLFCAGCLYMTQYDQYGYFLGWAMINGLGFLIVFGIRIILLRANQLRLETAPPTIASVDPSGPRTTGQSFRTP